MGYKMKKFSGFKNSPLKQSSVLDPESGRPWASKKDYPKKVQLGKVPYMSVDVSGKEGRDILNRYKNVKTIRSSDPSRIDLGKASKNVNVITGFGSKADKKMTSLVNEKKEWLKRNTVKPEKPKKLWRPFGPGTRPFAPEVTDAVKNIGSLVKKGLKVGSGTIGMMLMSKKAGATSTIRDNDITKMYKK